MSDVSLIHRVDGEVPKRRQWDIVGWPTEESFHNEILELKRAEQIMMPPKLKSQALQAALEAAPLASQYVEAYAKAGAEVASCLSCLNNLGLRISRLQRDLPERLIKFESAKRAEEMRQRARANYLVMRGPIPTSAQINPASAALAAKHTAEAAARKEQPISVVDEED